MWTWEVFQIDNTKATPNFITKLVLSLKCEAWVKQHTLYYPTIKHKWCHGPSNFQKIYIIMFINFHSFPSKDDTNCLWLTSINIIDKHEVLHICNTLVDVNPVLVQNVWWTPSTIQIQNLLKIDPIQVKTQFLPLAPTLHHYPTWALWIEKHKFMFLKTWTNPFSR